jgi:UDP-GlcNAc:undecaprenyl-phosphate GlcNAc-1-phosphate transferase
VLILTLVLVAGFGISSGMTPILRAVTVRRRGSKDPHLPERIPTTGGVAIYLATCLLLPFLALPISNGLLIGASCLALVGLADDFLAFSPLQKLVLQTAVVTIAVWHGLSLSYFGEPLLDGFVTTIWLVWMCNAYNVLDMMDGLAAGAGLISSLAMACLGFLFGIPAVSVISLALAGGLGGFLVYNIHPARIYMGDTGSLFCGFVLGALAVEISVKMSNVQGILAPMIILGLPIFEATFLCIVRRRKGLPVMQASRDHVAQRLVQLGHSVHSAVRKIWCAGAILGSLGIAVAAMNELIGWVLFCVTLLAAVWAGKHLSDVEMAGFEAGHE